MNTIDIKRMLLEASEDENENPYDNTEKTKEKETPGLDKVKTLLKKDIFNHSSVIRKLWGDSEATNRSLFRKKLESFKDDDGTEYVFTPEEVEKINSILQNVASDISHKLSSEDDKKARLLHKQRNT